MERYEGRLAESLGMRHKGKKSQSMKERAKESKGMEKSMGKRPFSGDNSMDKKGKGHFPFKVLEGSRAR